MLVFQLRPAAFAGCKAAVMIGKTGRCIVVKGTKGWYNEAEEFAQSELSDEIYRVYLSDLKEDSRIQTAVERRGIFEVRKIMARRA